LLCLLAAQQIGIRCAISMGSAFEQLIMETTGLRVFSTDTMILTAHLSIRNFHFNAHFSSSLILMNCCT
jgi:hypothetical protein